MNKKLNKTIKIIILFLLVIISLYSYFSIEQFIVDNAYKVFLFWRIYYKSSLLYFILNITVYLIYILWDYY